MYVRGRGRGKYICEECGIRCKKLSMFKKYIRIYIDVRFYVCKLCNFVFKMKGMSLVFVVVVVVWRGKGFREIFCYLGF